MVGDAVRARCSDRDRDRGRGRAVVATVAVVALVVISIVTVNIPPLAGQFTAKNGYAEVIVQHNQPRCFTALWGAGTMSVTSALRML